MEGSDDGILEIVMEGSMDWVTDGWEDFISDGFIEKDKDGNADGIKLGFPNGGDTTEGSSFESTLDVGNCVTLDGKREGWYVGIVDGRCESDGAFDMAFDGVMDGTWDGVVVCVGVIDG